MNVTIVYEDDFILCVIKPNNMVVHHAHHSRNVADEDSLLQILFKHFNAKFYPIHRLDRRTSGIILMAKETKYVSKFQNLFTENAIQKIYFGVVRGHAPGCKIIDSPVKGKDGKVHKDAETHLKTLHKIILDIPVKPYNSSRYSLVKLHPKTGRLHQLRIHMNKISHPLIGDAKYGDKNHNVMYDENFKWNNLFLHAHSLEFTHPFLEKELFLKADFPKNWVDLFNEFEWPIL